MNFVPATTDDASNEIDYDRTRLDHLTLCLRRKPLPERRAYSGEELVSADYIGNPHSCILDAKSTNVVDGTLVKVSGWYDNEWGYASRCVDLLRFMGVRL